MSSAKRMREAVSLLSLVLLAMAMDFSFLYSSYANMTFGKNRTLEAKAAIILVTYPAIQYYDCLPRAK